MYYLVVFWFGFSIITGLVVARQFFYSLVERTTSLLDAMLESEESDEVKQKLLIQRLSKLLVTLLLVIGVVVAILVTSLIPGYLYIHLNGLDSQNLDYNSSSFYVVLIVSSAIPFVLVKIFSKQKDYSEWSILFHRIVFNNYNISRGLYGIEKSFFKAKTKEQSDRFLIVSGLARAGTTALTTILHSTNHFHSLSYANMPLLLSPNFWRLFYRPKSDTLRERSHGDRVMFGHNTVEALEEFFWMIHLRRQFISADALHRHEIQTEVYQQYLIYQSLVRRPDVSNTIYLAKNNNFILRYNSIRKENPNFIMVILFRNPLEHAYSLLSQHKRYTKFQSEDQFVREYMGWLGHYEFGLDQKHFDFSASEVLKRFDKNSIDYWLRIWIDYYSFIVDLPNHKSTLLIDYKDLLKEPGRVIKIVGNALDIVSETDSINRFENEKSINFDGEKALLAEAEILHQKLIDKKAAI